MVGEGAASDVHPPPLHLQSSLGEELDHFGVGFRSAIATRAPNLGRIMIHNWYDALQDDRSVIVFLIGKMDGTPAHLDAIGGAA